MLALIISVIVFQVILLFLAYRYLKNYKPQEPVIVDRIVAVKEREDIETSVRNGMKSAVKELEYEKEQEELMRKKMKSMMATEDPIYTGREEKPIKSGGELIPFDITSDEREILRQFYGS